MGAPVQTSALVTADCSMELTGVLLHAEVAMKQLGDGGFVPAVAMEIDDVGAGRHRVLAHVVYQRHERDKAEERVRQLRPGQPITVRTNLTDLRLFAPAATFPTETP